ncbi:uncharacterized protein LOC109716331 isoform X2 [Ananas comosus]|uniref:Uncharacterized protein LOC109716331 isoform X2 n=1 Tax=Ananas comosus TaxID=4615 RepID=A0A6P5FNR5_ANACO|nr:uncharacterized protein LOC109716331 isoform X2 [Ananas comosus]
MAPAAGGGGRGGGGGGGGGSGDLADQFSGLGVRDSSNDNLYQMEDNNLLRDELWRKTQELERIKLEATSFRPSANVIRDDHTVEPRKAHVSNSPISNEADRSRWLDNGPSVNPQGTLVRVPESDEPSLQTSAGNPHYSESNRMNGTLKKLHGGLATVESAGPSQRSTPSSRSLSPTRHRKEGEYEPRLNLSGQGLMPVSEINSNILWKQDLSVKVRQHEEEIAQLRKHLSEYSMKEAQIRNEKLVLEKRIAYMRRAFDQQQQDLIDAASKALSYRQDIIEENIRLTYALQAAQQERSTFISSLVPILSEYGMQPSAHDAQSIVSNLKILFRHLQQKLTITEEKLKESQYQITPWQPEISNNTGFPPQSPSHPPVTSLITPTKNSLEIVPQPAYAHAQSPISSPIVQTRGEWEVLGNQSHQGGPTGVTMRNVDHDNLGGRNLPSTSRNPVSQDISARATQGDSHVVRFNVESKNQNPSFKDLARVGELEEAEASGVQPGSETSTHWMGPGTSPNLTSAHDDPNSYPYLPTVLEEPGSSFSEAAEDDPLPAIEGLRISGEAYPGRQLQASGYSMNGTTTCNFEWVRYLEDGSVNYIDGAKQPSYLVTADDVDCYLAIEVQPLDDRKRKGELVKQFANEQGKITCDPEMQEQIKRTLSVGHASYEVLLLSARFLDIWDPAVLAIKKEGYSIKCNGPRGVVVTEKFQQATTITIPYGQPNEFTIQSADGGDYVLKTAANGPSRDSIVLTLRLFKTMAVEKRKGRRKGLFFK